MSTAAAHRRLDTMTLADLRAADVATQVAALEELAAAITGRSAGEQSVDEDATVLGALAARTYRACGRLEAQRLGWLAVVEADGRWALDGVRTFPHWVSWTHVQSVGAARADARLARTLRDDLPVFSAAARSGTVTPEHVRTMAAAASTDQRRAALRAPASTVQEPGGAVPEHDVVEDVLVALAEQHGPQDFAHIARHFAVLADPDAADRAYRESREREHLDVSATTGGFHLAGFLTEEHGRMLRTAVDAMVGVPPAGDQRTVGQRNADGLTALTRLALDHGLAAADGGAGAGADGAASPGAGPAAGAEAGDASAGDDAAREGADAARTRPRVGASPRSGSSTRPHLTVTVTAAELQAALMQSQDATDRRSWATALASPPAQWPDGTPVDRAVLRRLACDSAITRVIFGPDSEVLDVGRSQRTVTGPRRRAIVARDRHCTFGPCDQPPSRCEVHHAVTHWADGGSTSTDNAALLCWHHHEFVDTHGIGMERVAGRWRFYRPDGTEITFGPPVDRGRLAPAAEPARAPALAPVAAPAPAAHLVPALISEPAAAPALGPEPAPGSGPGPGPHGATPPSRSVGAPRAAPMMTAPVAPPRSAPTVARTGVLEPPELVSAVEQAFREMLDAATT